MSLELSVEEYKKFHAPLKEKDKETIQTKELTNFGLEPEKLPPIRFPPKKLEQKKL